MRMNYDGNTFTEHIPQRVRKARDFASLVDVIG